jgi:CheY-like chemotaxis protein
VLLVDDSPTMRSIVRRVLAATRFPLDVTEAGDGGQALALARGRIRLRLFRPQSARLERFGGDRRIAAGEALSGLCADDVGG